MHSRLFWRRSSTALGIYAAALLGFLATIVAARTLGLERFGVFALVMAATGFFQTLLDLTVEEAVTKYGFRYSTAEDWGRLRRLFARALTFKGAGAVLAGLALLALAPLAGSLFGADGMAAPLAVAALLPLVQAPEGLAGTAIILRGRYDIRSVFLALSMALRLAAIAIGARYGVTEVIVAIVVAQVAATAAVSAAGWAAFRRFPAAPAAPLAADAPEIRSFVLQSSLATGVVSLRTTLSPLLLGVVSSVAQVGAFRAALAPQQGFYSLSAPARMILLTEQTRDWERGEHGRVFAGIRRYSFGAAVVMAVLVVPLLVFMPDLIRLAFTDEFVSAANAARIVLVAAVLQFVFGWTKSFPVSIGRPNLRVVTHGVETIVLVPLVLVLGARWGATGAAAAVLIATVVFSAHWTILFLRVRRDPRLVPRASEAVAR
ncbi:MAG: lipopolysaccharide biosynthesis protein [Gaiellaceae bacterium]